MTPSQLLSLLVVATGPYYVGPQPPPPPPVECPEGWSYWNNYCYFFSTEPMDWYSAQDFCNSTLGSHLASITSWDENNFIREVLTTSYQNAWIGLHDDNNGKDWHWTDGTDLAYTNWRYGEPSDAYGNEHCGEVRTDGTWQGQWNDNTCSTKDVFVCKTTVKTCPESFTYKSGKCYYASNFEATWSVARDKCKEFNTEADLVSIHSEDENSFFASLLTHSSPSTWLGMTYNSTASLWSWTDGSDNDYTNWNKGEPNSLDTEWCAESIDYYGSDTFGKWNNLACSESRAFGCEFFPTHVVGCENGWWAFGKYCYRHSTADFSNEEDTYAHARFKCQKLGGDLVSIHSSEENDFVFSLLGSNNYYTGTWIGMTDDGHPGDITWSDDTSVTFTNWETLNSYPFTYSPSCASYPYSAYSGVATWSLGSCDITSYYVCKKPQQARPINPPQNGCVECSSRSKRSIDKMRIPWIPQHRFESIDSRDTARSHVSLPFHSRFSSHFPEVYGNMEDLRKRIKGIHKSAMVTLPSTQKVPLDSLSHRFRNILTGKSYDQVSPFDPVIQAGKDQPRYFSFLHDKVKHNPIAPAFTPKPGDMALDITPRDKKVVLHKKSSRITPFKLLHKKPANVTDESMTTENLTSAASPITGCKTGDEAYKGSCYTFPDVSSSWRAAKTDCVRRDAHLLVVNDRFESAHISAFLGQMNSQTWIGLSGTESSDGSVTFSWVNNDPVDFTNWDESEPDPDHGTCVSASGVSTSLGLWTVKNCEDQLKYICEYDREGYTTPAMPTTKPPSTYCAEGWAHRGDRCYKVFPKPSSWGGGEQFCASFGGHLVSVGSADEQEQILVLPGMADIGSPYQSVWVGLKMGSESGYEWTDGTPFSYVDWAEGQPDSHYNRENCASADKYTFKLSDSVCDAYLPFVCEAREGTMVTTLAPPTETPDVMCDDDPTWYLYDNHCYKFVSASEGDPQTWWGSHQRCRDEGSELASIHSYEENYWMESKMFELSDNILWVGGRSTLDSGYTWIDDSPFDFENWAKGEPNNLMDQEDCLALYTHQEGHWNDQSCAHTDGRVCKRPHGITLPPIQTTPVPDGHCPRGWLHTGTKCLQIFTTKKNFEDARSSCKELGEGVDLASIHSAAEQAYLTAALGTMETNVWIGLRNERDFQWVDQSVVTYTNWAPGEPNGAWLGNPLLRYWPFDKTEDCVELMIHNRAGQWNDVSCLTNIGYVCQRPTDSNIVTNSPPPSCEPPFDHYISYGDACYRPDSNAKTWQEAESACAGEGAHLASARDRAEGALIWVLIQESGFTDVWIGLNSLEDGNVFKWSDGWPTMYTNWDKGEPNISFSNHNCTRVRTTNGHWFTESCNETSPFICKYKNGTVPTPDPPVTGYCPDSRWLDLGGGYCYLISDQKKPWNDASMNCAQEDANLVSVHSEAEMNLISMATHNIKDPLWIGLVQKKDGYGWSDHSALNYINWDDGEPNDVYEMCAEMYPSTGRWNDAVCSNARNFICKILKIQQPDPTNPPLSPVPRTTHHPSGWKSNALGAGGIIGIILATLLVTSGVGYVGYSYIQKKPKPVGSGGSYSFDNALYSGKDDNSKVQVNGAHAATLDLEADCGGTNA